MAADFAGATAPGVRVVVLQWNGWNYTRDCLESLARCTYPRLEVVVVDNGSTDGSLESLRAHPVRRLENGRNLGYSEGNNVALREALRDRVDLVMLLNNDTLVDPGFLEPLVRFLGRHRRAGAVAPLIHYAEPADRIWFAGGIVNFWLGLTAHRGIRARDVGQYRVPARCGYLSGCALLLRREALEQVGLLDPSYVIYTEDADLSQRLRNAGHQLWMVPDSRIRHRVSASSGGGSTPFKIYHRTASNLKFFRRHAQPWHWLTWPLSMLGFGCVYSTLALIRRRPDLAGAWWRGLVCGVTGVELAA